MATYASLTAEQKARLSEYDLLARPLAGELARLMLRIQSSIDLYNNDVIAILTLLDNGELIPIEGGLASAAAMTDLDHVTLQSYFQGVAAYNTAAHRANYVQAAGAANTV